MIITEASSVEVKKVISQLGSVFSLKDLNTLSYFLGIEASRSDKGLLLTQKKYIDGLLSKASMSK